MKRVSYIPPSGNPFNLFSYCLLKNLRRWDVTTSSVSNTRDLDEHSRCLITVSLLEAVKDQFVDLPITKVDLTGRTVVVLGANVGLGLEGKLLRPLLWT